MVNITLTDQEAYVLRCMLNRIGGYNAARELLASVKNRLDQLNVSSHQCSNYLMFYHPNNKCVYLYDIIECGALPSEFKPVTGSVE
jgi:hypothetical protein